MFNLITEKQMKFQISKKKKKISSFRNAFHTLKQTREHLNLEIEKFYSNYFY